jgi:hypothetical protein
VPPNLATLIGRLDLNRTLTPYPAPDATTGLFDTNTPTTPSNLATVQQAISDRQNFATDIFNALRAATGALDTGTAFKAPYGATSAEYMALRWLAQLAVNIVDYIDPDDYNTPFHWDTNRNAATDVDAWVFGTELPRLVINEFYSSYDNDNADTGLPAGPATYYRTNVWVELHNPFFKDSAYNFLKAADATNPWPDQQAFLVAADLTGKYQWTNYQVILANEAAAKPLLLKAENVTGDPDFGSAQDTNALKQDAAGTLPCRVTDYYPTNAAMPSGTTLQDYRQVTPSNGSYTGTSSANSVKNGGFYVLGPDTTFVTGADPGFSPTSVRKEMSAYNLLTDPVPTYPMVLLRRLACPGMPPQTDPSQANYNPYVTVDYVDYPNAVNDARFYNPAKLATPPTLTGFNSVGRTQPYTAALAQFKAQAPIPANATGPQNTFFRHNAIEATPPTSPTPWTSPNTMKVPFDWLVHLDRQLISPVELLHVSGFKPHELTQRFVDPTSGVSFSHRAPWTTEKARIYRLLELVETRSRANGVCQGGITPGKININLIQDQEIFNALADPQSANFFASADVTTVFNALIAKRDPSGGFGTGPGTPFWGFGVGSAAGGDAMDPNQIPNGTATPRGITNTLLSPNTTTPMTFDPYANDTMPATSAMNPYKRLEMLTKIYNNLTTRSNVFAVWLTAAFFKVTDDTQTPVQLGAELGSDTGQQVRHHMFAIVDRTQLTAFSTTTNAAINVPNYTAPNPAAQSSTSPLQLSATSGTNSNTGRKWNLQVGSVLVYDPNTDTEETVVAQSDGKGGYQANFYKNHSSGATVISRGNPGPWTVTYDARNDTSVVPFFYIID